MLRGTYGIEAVLTERIALMLSSSTVLQLPSSRSAFVLQSIRRSILNGEYAAGAPLVEQDIAERLGVSKTPVREALKVLAGSGLVVVSPYKGASVAIMDQRAIRSIYELRMLVEPEAVQQSVQHIDDQHAVLIDECLARAREACERAAEVELSLLNREFHRLLYANCDNELMVVVLDELRDRAAFISVAGWKTTHSSSIEYDEHCEIWNAAQGGDGKTAARLLRRHIQRFMSRVTSEPADAAAGSLRD